MEIRQKIYIYLMVIISFNFFDARFLGNFMFYYFRFYFVSVAIIITLPYVFLHKGKGFIFPIKLILLSMVLSIIMAYVSWNQEFMDSMIATAPYMVWIFFFYLVHKKIPIKDIESIVLVYGIIYIVLYFFQISFPTTLFFGWENQLQENRGVIRYILPGGGVFFLASFMALNNLTTRKENYWLWRILVFFGVLIPFLQATRQVIIATVIIYIYHFIKDTKSSKKLVIIFSCVIFFVVLFNSDIAVIKGLKDAQEQTASEGDQYIRVVAGAYFLNYFSPNEISKYLGNGMPYGTKSYFGKFVTQLKETQYFFLDDVGIIAGYVMFGIIFVIAYLMIWYKSFTIPLPKEYYYLKYYLWLLLITCLTSDSVYTYNYLITTVFALYIYQTVYDENRIQLSNDLQEISAMINDQTI